MLDCVYVFALLGLSNLGSSLSSASVPAINKGVHIRRAHTGRDVGIMWVSDAQWI